MISRRLLLALVLLAVVVSGLGLYVLHFVQGARIQAPVAVDTRPLAPPVAGPTSSVVLFCASDEDGTLYKQMAPVTLPAEPAQQARVILHTLVAQYEDPASLHPLEPGADIKDVYLLGGGLAVVDVNAAFSSAHPSGILTEELTLASMTQTLAANVPGVVRMKLLIEGKERATLAGHVSLLEPYEAANAARLVKQ